MDNLFAHRMENTPQSFIREILKVTKRPEIISFAGGLPNPKFFPASELAAAAQKVLLEEGASTLQYSTTSGYRPLREYIAHRYEQQGLAVSPDQIIITNGSQQGLDLIGKVLLNAGEQVIIEQPGYLGAIQAFSLYEAEFLPLPLVEDGPDLEILADTLQKHQPKLLYAVPNFQNPSGLSYSVTKREAVAQLLQDYPIYFVEDNPYGELRFTGQNIPSLKYYLPEQTILLGSFSKIVAPGVRLGWLCAPLPMMRNFSIAKQASDLHSNYLAQKLVHQYLLDNDLEAHLNRIRTAYGRQRDLMVSMLDELFPPEIQFTRPEGGMFLWLTLPDDLSSMALFHRAAEKNVAFVPGHPFYIEGQAGGQNTLRLNFSNSDEARIEEGMLSLAQATRELVQDR